MPASTRPHEPSPQGWLARAARLRPRAVALMGADRELAWASRQVRTRRLAADLQARGLDGGPMAVLSLEAETIAAAFYLALHTGQPLLPLDPRRESAAALARCGITQLLVDRNPPDPLPPHRRCFILPSPAAAAPPPSPGERETPCSSPDASAAQLLIPTSGTSARPKVVMLSGANLAAAVRASRARIPLTNEDRWLDCLPLTHIGGLSILLRCLEVGATAVLRPFSSAAELYDDIKHYCVSHLSLVPSMLAHLLAIGRPPPASLRHILVGGAALPAVLARRALDGGWPIRPSYGLSEAGSQVATWVPGGCGQDPVPLPGQAGRPLPGTQVELVDQQGRPTHAVGRVCITGPTVMTGYANPHLKPGDGLRDGSFVSNDLGRLDTDGCLHILGRADEVLVSGGVNIHPQEVESRLASCPGVEEVGVTALPDEVWGDRLVALIVGGVDEARLDAWSRVHLAGALRPRRFLAVEGLPRGALGKLDRRALRDVAAAILAGPE